MTAMEGTTREVPKRLLKRKNRQWIHGIGLAVLPILVAYGLIGESEAALWAALLGAIIVPSIALKDNHEEHERDRESYLEGYDKARSNAGECETCGTGGKHGEL